MKKFLPLILIAIGFLLPLMSSAQVVECPVERNDCQTALLMCSLTEEFMNPNPVGAPGPFPGCPSNVIDNQYWYRFIPITTNITINITSSNCQNSSGIQAGVYSDCSNLNTPIVTPQCGCTTGPITFALAGLTLGQEYYIMVDGCAGDICDVVIDIVQGDIDTDGGGGGPGATPPAPYGSPLIVCSGDVGIYNFEPQGPGTYIWLLDGGQLSSGTSINASCENTGAGVEGLVEILWQNFSGMPSDECFTLTYEYIASGNCGAGSAVESDPLEICFDDEEEQVTGFFCFREEPDGFFYTGDNMTYFDGTYNTVVEGASSRGCDLFVELEVSSFFPNDSIIFFAVCPGDSIEFEGEFYRAPQNGTEIIIEDFYDRDPNGEKFCDKYVQLTMVELDPDVAIGLADGTSEINCVNTEVTLFADADPNDVDYTWFTPDGTIVPITDDTIRATSAGTYIVTVELTGFGTSCFATDTIVVTENINSPSVSATKTDILCGGETNGTASATGSGGIPPYTYAWSNGETTTRITGLVAGPYTVTITGDNGCTSTASVTIEEPTPIALTTSAELVDCNGGNNGEASVTASGGSGNYTYAWSTIPVQNAATATGLTAGTYTVTVTDSNNCSRTETAVVNEPTAVTTTIASSLASCAGGDDGTATVTPNGGTGAYTFAWSTTPSQSTATATNLLAGTYTVTVTDNNGCTTTNSVVVDEAPALTLTSSDTDPLCNGSNEGSATVVVAGGTGAYTYAWSTTPVQTTATANNLTAGTYTVIVTDANGCTIDESFNLGEPTAVLATIDNTTDVLCSYSSDGTASASGSGGTPPYTFTWSDGTPAGGDVSDLPIGDITVIVTDNNGCTGTATATIGAPDALDLQMSQVDALCNGEANGSASVVVTGGTQPYTYQWSNGQFGDEATLIPAGTHTVTVTDNNGCTAENSIVVGEPTDALSITGTSADATCGEANGVVNLLAAGGTPPYTFNWPSDGDARQDRDDLAPGTYTPGVIDANGCRASVQVIVSTANQFQVDAIAAVDVLCNGDSDGAVNVDISGGVPPYTYIWSNSETTEDINGLPIGTYTITVTDNTGCTLVADALVEQPDALATTAQVTDAGCGQSNGSVSVSPTGGITPYTYTWSNGGSTTATLSGVPLGDYTVTITDANGCTFEETQSVGNPNSPEISAITGENLDCFQDNSGSISVSVINGTPPFTYAWAQNGPVGASPSGLPAGTYTVMVTDSRNCETMASVTLTEPDVLEIQSISAVPALCGQSNGSIEVIPTGGTAPYTYQWSGISNTTNNPTNLPPGNYVVNITDANGCITQGTASTVAPGEVMVTADVNNALCFEGDDGNIDVTLNGGTGPFTFNWDYQNETSEDLNNLPAGDYVLTVTDGNGCTFVNQYTITQPEELTAVSAAQDATCGNADGNISLGVSGGVQPYTYAWSDGTTTTQNISNLFPGAYTVTITDQNGCVLIHNADPVELPDGPTVEFASVIDAQCFNATDGVIELDVIGGTQPYTFQWSDGSNDISSNTLGAGTVSITITDSKNCEVIVDTVINHPDELLRDQLTINEATCGDNNGAINLTMLGGTAPYTYSWSPTLPNSPNQDNLGVGIYRLVVTDAQGCTYEESFNVSEPGALEPSIERITNVSCNGGSDGEVIIVTQGGTAPYTYTWSVPAIGNDSIATGLPFGDVSVTVTDANGCDFPINSFVDQPDALALSQTGGSDATCNEDNGSIEVVASGGVGNYTFDWPSPIPQGPNPTDLAAGAYIVTVTDGNGCTTEASFSVLQPGQPTYEAVADSVNCNGESNGSVTLSISGGEAPFTYLWSNSSGSTDQDLVDVPAGTYTVTITDAIGCTYTAQSNVGEPEEIRIDNSAALDANCNGDNSGSLAIVVVGGTPPFNYDWSNGNTTDNPGSLTAGNYQVTITDKNGCSITDEFSVAEPEALALSLSVDDVNCNRANDGSISSTVSGGISPYTYAWSNGGTTDSATDLLAGPYSLVVTDANGCTITASETVSEPGPIEVLVSDISEYGIYNVSCYNSDDGAVTVTAQGSTAPYTYLWNTGETVPSLDNILPGTYAVEVTDGNGCSTTEEVTLIAPEPLVPAIQSVSPTCFGYSNGLIFLESIAGGTAPFVYSIDGQPFTPRPDFRNLTAGGYEVTVQDANGCEWADAVTLDEPSPLILDLGGDMTIEYGFDTILNPIILPQGLVIQEYSWSGAYLPDCSPLPSDSCDYPLTNFVVAPEETTDYTLYILDENNCSATETIRVNVEKPRRVYIPNVFSPNADNTDNQIFTIFTGRGVSTINKVEVFNRWGEVVYSLPQPVDAVPGNNSVNVRWDGTFDGEPMNPGVFVYYAEILFSDGHVEVYTGDITLVR